MFLTWWRNLHRYGGEVQNLDPLERGKWRYGRVSRWWSTARPNDETPEESSTFHVGFEWTHGPRKFMNGLRLKVSTTGEETLDVAYSLGPILSHYWAFDLERERPSRLRDRHVRIPIRIRFVVELGLTRVAWCFGQDDGSWSRDASWSERLRRNRLTWWHVSRYRRACDEIDSIEVAVPLPRKDDDGIGVETFPATVTLQREVWGMQVGPYGRWTRTTPRERWISFYLPGFNRVSYSAKIDIPDGLPVPGKGENSWDCGPDAIYGTGAHVPPYAVETREWVGLAVSAAVNAALRTRIRHGRGYADTGR